MKIFRGFTLSELMIALTVLGVLCATVLPAMVNNNPNQNKMMIKKAYYTFSDVINELINDDTNYPELDDYVGFDYYTCSGSDGCNSSTAAKLPFLFSRQLNLKDGKISSASALASNYTKSSTTNCIGIASTCYYVETNDGMIWTFPKSTLTQGSTTAYLTVGVDVNGSKKPNCYKGSSNCSTRTKNFDQFRMYLYADGKIKVHPSDTWAIEAIQVDSSLTEDD